MIPLVMGRHMGSLRGWQGNIHVNWNKREVQVEVDTEPLQQERVRGRGSKASQKGLSRDLKAFSGGERSFVNTCYTLALGDLIHTPFHCLDEIDVFMDVRNRRVGYSTAALHSCTIRA